MKEQQPLTSCQNAYYQRLRHKGKIYRDDCRFPEITGWQTSFATDIGVGSKFE